MWVPMSWEDSLPDANGWNLSSTRTWSGRCFSRLPSKMRATNSAAVAVRGIAWRAASTGPSDVRTMVAVA